MIAAIAKQLADGLQDAVNAGGREPQIIETFVNGARAIQTSSRFKIESIFIHQKPLLVSGSGILSIRSRAPLLSLGLHLLLPHGLVIISY